MADLIELVRGMRNLRSAAGVPAGEWVPLAVAPADGSRRRPGYGPPLPGADGPGTTDRAAARRDSPARRAGHDQRLGVAWIERSGARRRRSREAFLRQGIERLEALLGDARFVERARRPWSSANATGWRSRTQLAGLTGAG